MYENLVIRLIYCKKYIGSLFVKRDLNILQIMDYIKLLIDNFNTNLSSCFDKTDYDFVLNFLQASDKSGGNIKIPVNLKNASLKEYQNKFLLKKAFKNDDEIKNYVSLVSDDILAEDDKQSYNLVEINLSNQKINVLSLFDCFNTKRYIKENNIDEEELIDINYMLDEVAFNDICEFYEVLRKISVSEKKLFREKKYPNTLYKLK